MENRLSEGAPSGEQESNAPLLDQLHAISKRIHGNLQTLPMRGQKSKSCNQHYLPVSLVAPSAKLGTDITPPSIKLNKEVKPPCANLPMATEPKDGEFNNPKGIWIKKSHTFSSGSKTTAASRTAMPLPIIKPAMGANSFYYSIPTDGKFYFPELNERLKQDEYCECGLKYSDSELPEGWAMHITNDGMLTRRVFYQKGELTTWNWPKEITSLSQRQKEYILKMYEQSGYPLPCDFRQLLQRDSSPAVK